MVCARFAAITAAKKSGKQTRVRMRSEFLRGIHNLDRHFMTSLLVVMMSHRRLVQLRSSLGPNMVPQDFSVDLNEPLAFQVGHLGETYEEWVHKAIISKEGPRFFKSDFLEFMTCTVWWAIPVTWLPIVWWCISKSAHMGHTLAQVASLVGIGMFIWTLLEYILHRFLFHIKTKSYWGNTIHYVLHGCHHKHPMDGLRLVLPPVVAAIFCVSPWIFIKLVFTPSTAPAVFGGGLLGYVMYDLTHYYLHHGHPTNVVGRNLKRYHLNHHFRIQNKGFGVTSSLWDMVFGTLPETKRAAEKIKYVN